MVALPRCTRPPATRIANKLIPQAAQALRLLGTLPEDALKRIIDIGTTNGASHFLHGLMGTCHTLDGMCRALVYRHLVIRAAGTLDPFAPARAFYESTDSANIVGHVRVVQLYATYDSDDTPQRCVVQLHTTIAIAKCMPNATIAIVNGGDIEEDQARIAEVGAAEQITRFLFYDAGKINIADFADGPKVSAYTTGSTRMDPSTQKKWRHVVGKALDSINISPA